MFDPRQIDMRTIPESQRAHVAREAQRIHERNQQHERMVEREKDYAKERFEKKMWDGLSRADKSELQSQLNNHP